MAAYFQKDSGRKTVTYAEALDQALCFGWIDGQKKSFDELSWIQKFTPRRPRSGWSKLNTQHVERLHSAGQMMNAGLKAVAAAKADGRWQAAYDSARNAAPPEDFYASWAGANRQRLSLKRSTAPMFMPSSIACKTAKKPETRERRMQIILAMMSRGEKFH